MKISLVFVAILSLSSFISYQSNQEDYPKFKNITRYLSVKKFETIKSFVLKNGDRQTYCMKTGNNPHFSFDGFELYLQPEVGQKNIGCDTSLSDFNLIDIRDINTFQQYHQILVVRKGDLKNKDIASQLPAGVKEGSVYVLQYHEEYDLSLSVKNVKKYIQVINKKMKMTDRKE